jgi:hypothetical protein
MSTDNAVWPLAADLADHTHGHVPRASWHQCIVAGRESCRTEQGQGRAGHMQARAGLLTMTLAPCADCEAEDGGIPSAMEVVRLRENGAGGGEQCYSSRRASSSGSDRNGQIFNYMAVEPWPAAMASGRADAYSEQRDGTQRMAITWTGQACKLEAIGA